MSRPWWSRLLRVVFAGSVVLAAAPAGAVLVRYNIHPINIRTNVNYIGFQVTEAFENPANCNSGGFYAMPTASDSKAALAVLLAANLAGRTVTILVSDTACESNSGRPIVTDVILEG